jgi:integration host factor subunit beta
MKKSELITSIRKLYPFLKTEQVADVIDIVFNELSKGLKQGKRIELRGFGSFSLRQRKVQTEFPSKTQETIKLNNRNTIYFRMGKEFFTRLNPSNEQ